MQSKELDENWQRYMEWDKKYYLTPKVAQKEIAPIPVAKVEDSYYILPNGTRILDLMNGYICVNAGQRNPRIQEAIKNALDEFGYVHEGFLTKYRAILSKMLIEDILANDGWAKRVRFTSSGSEAVEMALLLARLYTRRPYIVTQQYSFHGWTEGAANCTQIRNYGSIMTSPESNTVISTPLATPGYHVAPAPPIAWKSNPESVDACLEQTERMLRTIGVEKIAGFITEPIFGVSSILPSPEYHRGIREMCTRLGILWIDDEVMMGFGRTGKWFAYQHYDIKPDLMVVGKGINSSHLPLGGVVLSEQISEYLEKYRLYSTATHHAHPVALASAIGNLEFMMAENTPERAAKMGEYFLSKLTELSEKHECVGYFSGQGLSLQIELVKNKRTKEPFIPEDRDATMVGDLSHHPVNIVQGKCLEKNVYCTGLVPNSLRIATALTVSEGQIDQAVGALDYAFTHLDQFCTG